MPGTVRAATAADVPSLEVVRRQAMEAGFTDQYPRSAFADLVATPDDRLSGWISDSNILVLVAETDITPVCFGACEMPVARVLSLHTAPEYQNEGWASALLERFEARTRQDGHTRLEATVPLNAVGFFESRGFERRATSERAGLTMVEVEKSLDR